MDWLTDREAGLMQAQKFLSPISETGICGQYETVTKLCKWQFNY